MEDKGRDTNTSIGDMLRVYTTGIPTREKLVRVGVELCGYAGERVRRSSARQCEGTEESMKT